MTVCLILTGDKLLAGKGILLSKSGPSFTTRFTAVTGLLGLIRDEYLLNFERILLKSNPERLRSDQVKIYIISDLTGD